MGAPEARPAPDAGAATRERDRLGLVADGRRLGMVAGDGGGRRMARERA